MKPFDIDRLIYGITDPNSEYINPDIFRVIYPLPDNMQEMVDKAVAEYQKKRFLDCIELGNLLNETRPARGAKPIVFTADGMVDFTCVGYNPPQVITDRAKELRNHLRRLLNK